MRTPVSRVEVVVGLFAVVVIALLLLALFNAARDANLLREDLELTLWIERGQGLAPGSPVTLNEVTVGRVTEVELRSRAEAQEIAAAVDDETARALIGPVQIAFTVQKEYAAWITAETTATIATAPIPGISKSEIQLNPLPGAPIGDETRLDTTAKSGIMDVFESFPDKLLAEIKPTAEGVTRIIANVESITADVARGSGLAGVVLRDEALADDVRAIVASARKVMEETERLIPTLVDTLENVRRATADVAEITAQAKVTMGRADAVASDVRDLVRRVDPLLDKVEGIMDDARRAMTDVTAITGDLRSRSGVMLDRVQVLLQDLVATVARLPAIARKVDLQLVELGRVLVSVKRNFLIRGNLPEAPVRPSEAEALPRGGAR